MRRYISRVSEAWLCLSTYSFVEGHPRCFFIGIFFVRVLDKLFYLCFTYNMIKYIKKDGTERIYYYPSKYHKKSEDINFVHGNTKPNSRYTKYYIKPTLKKMRYCAICGNSSNLNVHHKDGNSPHKVPNPNNNESNLITLCHKCHIGLHYNILDKHKDIITLRKQGYTYQKIADIYCVSRQRIHQIVKNNEHYCYTNS